MKNPTRNVWEGWLALTPVLSVLAGCSTSGAPEAFVVEATQPIIGGVPSSRESVVTIRIDNSEDNSQYACSASLVAPRLLLTARHCVSEAVDGQYVCTSEGDVDESFPRSPFNAGEMGAPRPASSVTVFTGAHPDLTAPAARGVRIFAPETDTTCRNDIAFVELDTDLDLPIAALRLHAGVFPGELVTAVGFGLNDAEDDGRYELSGLPVLSVGPSEFYPVEGNSMPRTFVLGKSTCDGDSGGPAISDETGAVLGLFSSYRGACTSTEVRNVSTQVAPFHEFIDSVFAEVGETPVLEGEDAPTAGMGGEAGSSTDTPKEGGGCAMVAAASRPGRISWALPVLLLLGASVRIHSRRERSAPKTS